MATNPFAEGVLTAEEQKKYNPFNVILGRFQESFARKQKERAEEDKDLRDLNKALQVLSYKNNYDTELAKLQEQEKRKTGLLESISKGEVSEVPEGQEEPSAFEGTPFGITGKKFKSFPNIDKEAKKVELQIKNKQLEQLNNEGKVSANEKDVLSNLGIPEEEKDDYIIKTATQTIRGIKTQVPILERKKTLPAKEASDLSNMASTKQDLNKNILYLKDKGLQLGPGFSTTPGAISDVLGQIKGSDFATLKASIGRTFQKYRKWATGVASGYPELNMLAPNYPKATDTNDVFISKTLDVMKDIERNQETTLNYFGDAGYAVGKLKARMKQEPITQSQSNKKTITLPSGKTISIGQ